MTGRKKSWRSREETGQKRVVLTAETKAEGPRAAELIIGLAGLAAVIIALLGLLVLVGVLGGSASVFCSPTVRVSVVVWP